MWESPYFLDASSGGPCNWPSKNGDRAMQKWSFFAMGVMAGVIAILGFSLAAQGHGTPVYAQGYGGGGGGGMGDAGLGMIAIPGSSQQSVQDSLWVIHKGPVVPELQPPPSKDPKE